jgi:hypothetical protein
MDRQTLGRINVNDMPYIVTYSTVSYGNREIGRYNSLADAKKAARKAGAIGSGEKNGRAHVYDVAGHRNDDNYGIWIEEAANPPIPDNWWLDPKAWD